MKKSREQLSLMDLVRKEIGPPIPPSKFRVFVFGPGLEPDAVISKPRYSANDSEQVRQHGQYLRFATKKALEKEGFPVDFGESKDPFRFWQFCYKGYDNASHELYHARWECGAIVVFPSSEGSVCEISLISLENAIARKTMAIIHEPFRKHESFFQKAVVELFWQAKGTREYLNYAQHNACVSLAVKFVKGQYTQFLRAYQTHKDSKTWASENATILSRSKE